MRCQSESLLRVRWGECVAAGEENQERVSPGSGLSMYSHTAATCSLRTRPVPTSAWSRRHRAVRFCWRSRQSCRDRQNAGQVARFRSRAVPDSWSHSFIELGDSMMPPTADGTPGDPGDTSARKISRRAGEAGRAVANRQRDMAGKARHGGGVTKRSSGGIRPKNKVGREKRANMPAGTGIRPEETRATWQSEIGGRYNLRRRPLRQS